MNRLDPALYTIAWIAPLEIEAQAALHMLDHRHRGRFPVSRGDDYVFQAGDINGHNIIIATLPESQEYGTGSAAALASQVKKIFPNLWFGLLVGVAAGLPNLDKDPPLDIRLGDVLVGLPEGESAGLIAYELGKETASGFQLLQLGRVLANTETVVRSAIGSIKMMAPNDVDEFLPLYETIKDKQHPRGTFQDPGQERDVLYSTDGDGASHAVKRDERPADRRTRVWYGPIGSGDKLVKNAEKRNELRDKYNIIGLEMEAAGTMNRIPVGVIRGVCDYGDEHKNKDWQPYAAAMAAAYAKAVLHHLGPGDAVSQQSDICEVPPSPLKGAILCELPPKTDRFFGRESELSDMIKYLEHPSEVQKGVVLCGISGSGKTQLAHEYVDQRRLQFSAILWIDAGSETSIEQSFASCFERICEQVPGVRAQGLQASPKASVLDWLRNTLDNNWLVVIDRANDPIPNRTLLEPFMKLPHGSVCVTSTHKPIARLLKRAQILVESLDRESAQSLLLWRASTGDEELTEEDRDGARQAAKILDGFPLGLELAGILIHERIMPLGSFARDFTDNYKRVARFQVDPGMWMWDTSGSLFSMFDALYKSLIDKNPQTGHLLSLCSVYGPWSIPISLLHGLELHRCQESVEEIDRSSQLQDLVDNDVELKLAIHDLERLFLVKTMGDGDGNVVSISLHASLCQWRLAAMDKERTDWIMQASYGLASYIQSYSVRKGKAKEERSGVDIAYRLSSLIDGCLDAISRHIDEGDLMPPSGRFATHFFMISSSIADLHYSLGKLETAKKLYAAAIDYIRTTQTEEMSNLKLVGLLRGFSSCCAKTGDLVSSQEALKSALAIVEPVCGQMSDEVVEIASRLRVINQSISTELNNRKRALIASTGGKIQQAGMSGSDTNNHQAALVPALVDKLDEVPAVPQCEAVSGNNMECQMWFSSPVAIMEANKAFNIQGGIYLQVFKGVHIADVTYTASCISITKRPEGGDLEKIIYSRKRSLQLVKVKDLSSKRPEKRMGKILSGIKSMLAKARPGPFHLKYLMKGSYVALFAFGIRNKDGKTRGSVRTEHGSIRYDVQVEFGRPRPFPGPLLQLRHEFLVILTIFWGIPEEREDDFFHLDFHQSHILIGTSIQVKADLSRLDFGTARYFARCVLVQDVTYFPKDSSAPERSQRRISLSSDYRSAEDTKDVWIPIERQSAPTIINFQLPTCRQMRDAHKEQLIQSCDELPFTIEHCLEMTLGAFHQDPASSGCHPPKMWEPSIIQVRLVDCRINTQTNPPISVWLRREGLNKTVLLSRCGCYDAEVSRLRCLYDDVSSNLIVDPRQVDLGAESTGHSTSSSIDIGEVGETNSLQLHPRRSISNLPGRADDAEIASIVSYLPDYDEAVAKESDDGESEHSFIITM